VVILKPDRSLHFPGVEVVRNLISKKALKHQDAMIVVDCVNLIDIDFTGAKALGSVADALGERNQTIVFVNVSYSVDAALKGFTHGGVQTYETAQQWIETCNSNYAQTENSKKNCKQAFFCFL
jgi:anti-anti-sigma regulatory factor